MRRRNFHMGRDSGIGAAIFFLMIICFPILGYVFSLIDFILSNIFWVMSVIVVILLTGWLVNMDSNIEDEEEEM